MEKNTLHAFVVNLILRNPWSLHQAKLDDISIHTMTMPEIQEIDHLLQDMKLGGTKSFIRAANKHIWLDKDFNNDKNIPIIFEKDFQEMHLCFLYAGSNYFITSSFPAIYATNTENNYTHFNFLFIPICPKVALLYSKQPNIRTFNNRIKYISGSLVIYLNQLYLKTQIEKTPYIFSHNKEFLKKIIN